MQLQKHLDQGRLLYLTHSADAIAVCENDYYRWMVFSSTDPLNQSECVVQSVMNTRKPWLLTLPHHIAMMLPLLFFRPKSVVELGLGGGNLGRFLHHVHADIHLHSIEYNADVIRCYQDFFNPENIPVTLIEDEGSHWLTHQKEVEFDWLICDIYKQQIAEKDKTISQLTSLTENLTDDACLTLNLPDVSDDTINLCLTVLQQLQSNHNVIYFHIPNYLNIIIHLIPKHWHTHKLNNSKKSYLNNRLFARWRNFWLHGKKTNV